MDDDPLPDDERSERDRELHAAVLFRLKQTLEKLARERGDLKPQAPDPEKIQTEGLPKKEPYTPFIA
jgi:hypothetical protein